MNKFLLLLLIPFLCISQIPTYYSSVNFSNVSTLKSQLSTLITNTHTYNLIYTPDVWDALRLSDLDPTNSDNVLLIYGYNNSDGIFLSDRTRSKFSTCHTSSCNGLWVREHVFPKSLGTPNLGTEFAGSDAHNLRAIDNQMNNSRSNRRFDMDSGNSKVLSNGNFYPGDEWRGDVARMIMYMYLRYPTQCLPTVVGVGSTSYSQLGDMPNIFLEWNQQDPVSQYEINRNNVLEQMQGNRNPFIDNPYLATLIWNGPAANDTWGTLSLENSISGINVYPTITSDYVYFGNVVGLDYKYTIYSVIGNFVEGGVLSNSIDLTGRKSGVYIIRVYNDEYSKILKIVVK